MPATTTTATATTSTAVPNYVLEGLPSEEELAAKCLELGLVIHQPHTYEITHPALSLRPFPMKADVLYQLYDRQLLWNEAINRTSRNFEFLRDSMKSTAESDRGFTGRLLSILEKVYMTTPVGAKAPVYQPLMLGILRTDYMSSVDPESGSHLSSAEVAAAVAAGTARQWKNIEINTISCSFAGISPLVQRFHAYLHKFREAFMNVGAAAAVEGTKAASYAAPSVVATSPRQRESAYVTDEKHNSGVQVSAALAEAVAAWRDAVPYSSFLRQYQQRTGVALKPIVLAVVQENELNTADQYKLLLELLETHGVLSLRRTLAQLHETMQLEHATLCGNEHDCSTETKEDLSEQLQPPFAVVDKKYVVAVAYFRSTYVPKDLPTETAWQTRERIEESNAVKCPSVPYHLMTFKKMQQLMSNVSEVLAPVSFDGDQQKAAALAEHFVPQYSLNEDEYARLATNRQRIDEGKVINDPEHWIADAVLRPERYVLKPQLEGGGNLIAGEPMQRMLRDVTSDDPVYKKIRREYILMRKIDYPVATGVFFQRNRIHVLERNACSEVGIFGVILSSDANGYIINQAAGSLVRTKPADVTDGGVVAGVAALDSVQIIS
ncbi:putative glutathione synthetase [Leishmania infantum JPCM5]|uniref:Glutathione synthetase n=2 Tax=Leishmania infantum TaxID=5671 RepID=A0A6L0WQH8_LEIIN|nr:putative glutathione synthetase [Leishmania infantum JPCM5]CAC9469423.1 glutathione_synthetase_-_putative [Leishmania infantum]CAM66655.1 putative glutathione synthetase [Leishmania infantum JPCM5]SUZ40327.1 glutathione_synthetase_-_putative [Leishmania infantum]|eukprot:XP_001464275.1 putative glutathione synthetase [Leishmania infantum JPCM5]